MNLCLFTPAFLPKIGGPETALAEAIAGMHENRRDGRIEGFQRSARRRAEGMSWDAVADQYLALYEELPA